MMTIIYDFEHEKAMQQKDNTHYTIYQAYKNGKYNATHKRVKEDELYLLPKIFIYENHVSIVTGNQTKGGNEYIKHCRKFSLSIDRVNKVVFLKALCQE